MSIRAKYPRTPHLPFSQSKTSDDISGNDWTFLESKIPVVVTEKMDGECTTLYTDGFHARSLDSRTHPSRSWIAGLHGTISYKIPSHRRIIVESVYAHHSIFYDDLPTYAFGIGVVDLLDDLGQPSIDGQPIFLDWDSTLEVFTELGITPAPVLYQGVTTMKDLEKLFRKLDWTRQEGIVARSAGSFLEEDFSRNVGKAVRVGHVQSSEHWSRTWVPNKLAVK